MASLERLARVLGHAFSDPALLEQALTHRSAGANNYERLEFLGDSVLELVISEILYDRFPEASEGQLTRARASVVREPTLARVARSLDLGAFLRLGGGELKSGGFDRDSILADAVESMIGAIYLDAGYRGARRFIEQLFADDLENVNPGQVRKDAKTRLQEYQQSRGAGLPEYHVEAVTGASHQQHFVVHCRLPGNERVFHGEGGSKRKAEQAAAAAALDWRIRGEEINDVQQPAGK